MSESLDAPPPPPPPESKRESGDAAAELDTVEEPDALEEAAMGSPVEREPTAECPSDGVNEAALPSPPEIATSPGSDGSSSLEAALASPVEREPGSRAESTVTSTFDTADLQDATGPDPATVTDLGHTALDGADLPEPTTRNPDESAVTELGHTALDGAGVEPANDASTPPSASYEPASGTDAPTSTASSDRPAGNVNERQPLEDSRLEHVWESSMPTDAGRAFYAPDDTRMRETAALVSPADGTFTVDLHGSAETTVAGTKDGPVEMSPSDLASVIRSDPDWKGESVRLLSCDTGVPQPDGGEPYAQTLADHLGVEVSAPEGKAWNDAEGNVYASTAPTTDAFGAPIAGPVVPDSAWPRFSPRNDKEM